MGTVVAGQGAIAVQLAFQVCEGQTGPAVLVAHVDGLRPSVGALQEEAVRHTFVERYLQGVVIGIAPAVPHEGFDEAVLGADQGAALGTAADGGGIDVAVEELADGLVAEVAGGDDGLTGEAALHGVVPAMNVAAVHEAAPGAAGAHVYR